MKRWVSFGVGAAATLGVVYGVAWHCCLSPTPHPATERRGATVAEADDENVPPPAVEVETATPARLPGPIVIDVPTDFAVDRAIAPPRIRGLVAPGGAEECDDVPMPPVRDALERLPLPTVHPL